MYVCFSLLPAFKLINNLMVRTGTSTAFITWIPEKGGLYGEGKGPFQKIFSCSEGLMYNPAEDTDETLAPEILLLHRQCCCLSIGRIRPQCPLLGNGGQKISAYCGWVADDERINVNG